MLSGSSIVVHRSAAVLSAALWVIILFARASPSFAAETYAKAEVDQNGQLRILTTAGREFVPRKDKEQVGFEMAAISPDRRAVGWLALYPNCCTSYPIPLKLVIYASGQVRTFTGNDLPVWRWAFQAGGKHVAFGQETVHGGIGVHYELRDVATGRKIAEYGPSPDADTDAGAPLNEAPKWVSELDARR